VAAIPANQNGDAQDISAGNRKEDRDNCGKFGATDCELNYRHAELMYYTYKLEHVFFSEIGVYIACDVNYDRLVA
jgi:hypothetical protein